MAASGKIESKSNYPVDSKFQEAAQLKNERSATCDPDVAETVLQDSLEPEGSEVAKETVMKLEEDSLEPEGSEATEGAAMNPEEDSLEPEGSEATEGAAMKPEEDSLEPEGSEATEGAAMKPEEDSLEPEGSEATEGAAMKQGEDPIEPEGSEATEGTVMEQGEDPIEPEGSEATEGTVMEQGEDPIEPEGSEATEGTVMEQGEDSLEPEGPEATEGTVMKQGEDPMEPEGCEATEGAVMTKGEDSLEPEGPEATEGTVMEKGEDSLGPEGSAATEGTLRFQYNSPDNAGPDATQRSSSETDSEVLDLSIYEYYAALIEEDDQCPDMATVSTEPNSEESEAALPELSNETNLKEDGLVAVVAGGRFEEVEAWLSRPNSDITEVAAALQRAVQMDWAPVVYRLLSLGAVDMGGDAEFLNRLLTEAIRQGHLSAAEALIRGPDRRGGGCGQLGETGLILAAQRGASVQFAQLFANSGDGEDVNATDLHGRTALSYAAQHGMSCLVRWLCQDTNASSSIRDSQDWAPADYAMWALGTLTAEDDFLRCEFSEEIETLLQHGNQQSSAQLDATTLDD